MSERVALVTGAGRGIGLVTARRFLAEGRRVALPDVDGGFDATGIGRPTLRAARRNL